MRGGAGVVNARDLALNPSPCTAGGRVGRSRIGVRPPANHYETAIAGGWTAA